MIITQPNGENVALIAADELESLLETTHLLRSSKEATFDNEKTEKIF